MQYRHINKDFKNRKIKKMYEIEKHFFKFIPKLTNLPDKKKINDLRKIFVNKSDKRPVVKNFCLDTGHEYSILSKFRVCRHAFRLNVNKKLYAGIRKASW